MREEFLNSETQSFPHLLDMVATIKWQELGRNDFKPNFGSTRLLSLRLLVILPLFVTFRPEPKEYILDIKNMRYIYYNTSRVARLRRATGPDAFPPSNALSNYVTATAQNDYRFKFERGTTANQIREKRKSKRTIIRKWLSSAQENRNGRITLCEPHDRRRQPCYNLTFDAPSNHSEFEGAGARNARAYREHTHTHRQFRLFILEDTCMYMTDLSAQDKHQRHGLCILYAPTYVLHTYMQSLWLVDSECTPHLFIHLPLLVGWWFTLSVLFLLLPPKSGGRVNRRMKE